MCVPCVNVYVHARVCRNKPSCLGMVHQWAQFRMTKWDVPSDLFCSKMFVFYSQKSSSHKRDHEMLAFIGRRKAHRWNEEVNLSLKAWRV